MTSNCYLAFVAICEETHERSPVALGLRTAGLHPRGKPLGEVDMVQEIAVVCPALLGSPVLASPPCLQVKLIYPVLGISTKAA